MKTITSVVIAALMLGLVACGQEGSGATKADGSAAAATTATQAVTFVARPDLAESVEALPRLAGDSPAIVAINADLENRDAEARAGGCDGGGTGVVAICWRTSTGNEGGFCLSVDDDEVFDVDVDAGVAQAVSRTSARQKRSIRCCCLSMRRAQRVAQVCFRCSVFGAADAPARRARRQRRRLQRRARRRRGPERLPIYPPRLRRGPRRWRHRTIAGDHAQRGRRR